MDSMKKGVLFLLLLGAVSTNAQSLKDLLYSGKLKTDSNSVIRKGDDLSSKIDTNTKKPAQPEKIKNTGIADSASKKLIGADSATANTDTANSATSDTRDNNAFAKNNNTVWKDFMDSVISILKTDVLPSKKIKSETYYLYVDYEIGTDGQVNITNVVSSPENSFLQDQVKSILITSVPQLTPALDSTNKPRKVKRKYNFNITKE
jgi:hypothetical protein